MQPAALHVGGVGVLAAAVLDGEDLSKREPNAFGPGGGKDAGGKKSAAAAIDDSEFPGGARKVETSEELRWGCTSSGIQL
jgi:hypothetical protein